MHDLSSFSSKVPLNKWFSICSCPPCPPALQGPVWPRLKYFADYHDWEELLYRHLVEWGWGVTQIQQGSGQPALWASPWKFIEKLWKRAPLTRMMIIRHGGYLILRGNKMGHLSTVEKPSWRWKSPCGSLSRQRVWPHALVAMFSPFYSVEVKGGKQARFLSLQCNLPNLKGRKMKHTHEKLCLWCRKGLVTSRSDYHSDISFAPSNFLFCLS